MRKNIVIKRMSPGGSRMGIKVIKGMLITKIHFIHT